MGIFVSFFGNTFDQPWQPFRPGRPVNHVPVKGAPLMRLNPKGKPFSPGKHATVNYRAMGAYKTLPIRPDAASTVSGLPRGDI
ncbi:MAG: hypothetical protein KDE63_09725 [Novosphingobium sp.]|nr:hypothetical protein [Novosphingobium sp.]